MAAVDSSAARRSKLIANPPDRFAPLGFGGRRFVVVFRQQIENLRPEIQQLRLGIGAAAQLRGVELTDPMIDFDLQSFGRRIIGAGGQNEHHQQGGTHNAPSEKSEPAIGDRRRTRRHQFVSAAAGRLPVAATGYTTESPRTTERKGVSEPTETRGNRTTLQFVFVCYGVLVTLWLAMPRQRRLNRGRASQPFFFAKSAMNLASVSTATSGIAL